MHQTPDYPHDPYTILGVAPGATGDEIRNAWRDLVRIHHPDAGGDAEMFKRVQWAFETLAARSTRTVRHTPQPTEHVTFDGEVGDVVLVDVLVDHAVAVFGGRSTVTRWRLEHCDGCGGRGDGCTTCRADGRVGRYHTVTVDIPPRSSHGDVLHLTGLGEAGKRRRDAYGRAVSSAGPYGTLDIRLLVERDPRITEVGDDLLVQHDVSMYDAVLGASAVVHGLDGSYPVQVPAGTQPGDRLFVHGRGRPKVEGGRGSLVAVIRVTIPQHLGYLERRALESLRRGELPEPSGG